YMASINYDVHTAIPDGSVGPLSIVAWRFRRNGVKRGGGAHRFFDGAAPENRGSKDIPMIGNGTDVRALCDILMARFSAHSEDLFAGKQVKELETDALNSELRKIPHTPDEKLR
ncbi:MAG: hypothetical protein ACR2QJ_01645, partial [Geminicoccaceae bacterium]